MLATGFLTRIAPVIASAMPRVIAARCGLVALAALWKVEGTGDNASAGAVVLTSRAHEMLAPSMPRMPAIVPFESIDEWLAEDTPHVRLRKLLQPYWLKGSEVYELRPTALDARHSGDAADVLKPAAEALG